MQQSLIGHITPHEAEEEFYANMNALEKAAKVSDKNLSGKLGAVHCFRKERLLPRSDCFQNGVQVAGIPSVRHQQMT